MITTLEFILILLGEVLSFIAYLLTLAYFDLQTKREIEHSEK